MDVHVEVAAVHYVLDPVRRRRLQPLGLEIMKSDLVEGERHGQPRRRERHVAVDEDVADLE